MTNPTIPLHFLVEAQKALELARNMSFHPSGEELQRVRNAVTYADSLLSVHLRVALSQPVEMTT